MWKTRLSGFLFALLLIAAVVAFAFEYGSPVSRKGVVNLQVTDHSSSHTATVTINGALISSSNAVTSVRQYRKGRCIVVVVRESLVRPGRRAGKFRSEIAVTGDVDEIAFGDVHDVIWRK